jgi:hypothetical protein
LKKPTDPNEWRRQRLAEIELSAQSAIASLTAADEALTRYVQSLLLATQSTAIADIGNEASKRVEQMIDILQEALELERASKASAAEFFPPLHEEGKHALSEWSERARRGNFEQIMLNHQNITRKLEIRTIAFYYFAGRARHVIRRLPKLQKFDSVGARTVRNQLIEHPEGNDSGVIFGGFGFGGAQGPVIKAWRLEDQKHIHPDAGLYVNALEFGECLLKATAG